MGRPPDVRLRYEGREIIGLGDILLIAGTEEALAPTRGIFGPVIVEDLAVTQQQLKQAGAVITQPPATGPTGTLLYARHPDGTLVQYLQRTPELVRQIIG